MASAAFCNVTPFAPAYSSFVDSARVLGHCTQRQFQSTTELQQVTIFRLPSVRRSCVHYRVATPHKLSLAAVRRPCVHYRVGTPYKLSLASCCRLFERRGLRCRRKSNYVILDRCRRPHFQNHGRRLFQLLIGQAPPV